VIQRLGLVLIVLSLVPLVATSCAKEPAIASDRADSYERITGADGEDYLFELSSFGWEDKGQTAGASLEWIGEDWDSRDAQKASQAGEAARSLTDFLTDRQGDLLKLSTGWFGLQSHTVGELNPDLVQSFAVALSPYQGALVGDMTDLRGFTVPPEAAQLGDAKNVFAVIDTDTEAGTQFRDVADKRIKDYLRQYAEGVAGTRPVDGSVLARAGTLAGVVAAGQQASGSEAPDVQTAQHWVNWLNYELATALNARPGDGYLTEEFFSGGVLVSPDDVTQTQMYSYSGALQNFAHRYGQADAARDLRDLYDRAAGN
jgi:hypothetical protein